MRKIFLYGSSIAAVIFAILLASVFTPLPQNLLKRDELQSMTITDFRGVLLRETLNDQDGRAHWTALAEISPLLQQATIAVEDKRFFSHPGVDPIAVTRAVATNLRMLSFSSGGSTITQQVVKTFFPPGRRTISSKLREAWYALRLERMLSKPQILEEYLNRVSYGSNLRGAEAASWHYFHKHARDLSLAEAAFLAGIPNAPTSLNPFTHMAQARARQRLVLRRMRDQGRIAQDECERAMNQPLQLQSPRTIFRAPHVCDMVVKQYEKMNAARVATTIDEALQEELLPVIDLHLARLKNRNVTNAAVVVIENSTGEIRALVGSRNYFDETKDGQVNGATALRQPGSAIKPLMYALALESGHTAAEIVPDIPTAIPDLRGDYVPENYDRTFHGPVSIRRALACSYNVPAVRVLESVGKDLFLQRLRLSGFTSLTNTAEYYGYGLTLGNAEVSLMELANAYRMLANKGVWSPVILVKEARRADGSVVTIPDARPSHRVYTEEAACIISDILSDASARAPAFGAAFRFPFQCAVKTGTTKEYKDNWTVGFTSRYTVGVWAGNFDGSVMHGVSGVTGAGQIFTDIMTLLHTAPYGVAPQSFEMASGVARATICPRSGVKPTDRCPNTTTELFTKDALPTRACAVHRAFVVTDDRGGELEKVFECYGPEYAAWRQSSGLPVPPADAVPARPEAKQAGALSSPKKLRIASPNNGDCYKIDPALRREYQTITVRGFYPDGAENVRLMIDGGTEIVFSPSGYRWKLEKGVHQFQLIAMVKNVRTSSRPVTITVE